MTGGRFMGLRTLAVVGALLIGGSISATPVGASGPSMAVAPSPSTETRPADPIAHDPTMVKEGGWYYVVITGDSGQPNTFLPVKRSRDLVHWTELGPVFSTLPAWILPALGLSPADAPRDLWAPDLSYVNGEWRLYYAISQFGKNNSVIGLATTKSLDPASPDFGWVDGGLVLQSTPSPGPQEYNAIDPDFSTDANGAGWLSFGSFWTGIKMRQIDIATGKLSAGDTTLYNLATRPAPPDAIEGPSIVRHGGYYYLFVAFDFCCRGADSDYRVVVGRSASITGPYVDASGVPMLQGGGTEVLRGYNEFQGTGGADVYSSDGVDYFVNHYYDATDGGTPKLNVRTLSWTGGWPAVSDPINPSRSIGHGSAYLKILPRGGTSVVEDNGCGYEGANIGLWTDLGNTCQQWQIDDRGNGSRILNRYSNKVAEVAACNNVDGGNVAQWGWLGFLPNNDCQRWTFAGATDGYSTIASLTQGHRVWNAAGGATAAGTNIEITTPATPPSASEQFRFQPVGSVLLANPANPVDTLGVLGCRADNGNGEEVRMQPRSGGACQEWRLDSIAGTASYAVTNVATGGLLAGGRGEHSGGDSASLRLVGAGSAENPSWTLTPTNDGTWTLAGDGTSLAVKLLIP